MSISTQAAVTAATFLAAERGLPCTDPVVLHDGSNVVVHLRPAPVVARIATLTALVRPGIEAWFARDALVARHLLARGVPAARPLDEPVAVAADTVIGLWHHEPHDPARMPAGAEVAARLADLHAALRDLDADLPRHGPCNDIDRALPLVTPLLPAGMETTLRAENDRLRAALDAFPAQPLHGDAHPGNLLLTPAGPLWNDFEDTWLGPLGWDLACLANTGHLDGRAALAAYPALPSDDELAVCLELRELMGVVWRYVLALRWPDRRADADENLTGWSAKHR